MNKQIIGSVVADSSHTGADFLGTTGQIPQERIDTFTSGEPTTGWRKSSQALLPQQVANRVLQPGEYDMYPAFPIGPGKINGGYASLAEWIATQKEVMIDGMPGNDWTYMQAQLSEHFQKKGLSVRWFNTESYRRKPSEIEALVAPFVSEQGNVWGTRTTLEIADFFHTADLQDLEHDRNVDVNIIIGVGAALANWPSLVYVDLPKNEIQYRMRAGASVSLAPTENLSNPEVYKRLYFVDWVVGRKHRKAVQNRIQVIADAQWRTTLTWAYAKDVFGGLRQMSSSVIRARPWFEAGAWGGEWLKQHVKGINKDEINYAWSFELIVPENGLVLESDSLSLEVAFDWLMDRHAAAILGEDVHRFGAEFPIRFDFLDTMEGGNLSIQSHPSTDYIRQHFGESFTQDETYYILDCAEGAQVYLGFQEDIHPEQFRVALEKSVAENVSVTITDYVQAHPAQKHDLFLIPNQTIHSAGKNNLVLEISATPYIFTFKMYDWLRLDLEGKPRPINIEHAFNNLDFSRKGKKVVDELISKPVVLAEEKGHRTIQLPTHSEHFYDVQRHEFTNEIKIDVAGKCLVMMLVEGTAIEVTAEGGNTVRMNYAETFVVPAAVSFITVRNLGSGEAKLIKAFVKLNKMMTETMATTFKHTRGNRFSIWVCLVAAVGGLLFGFDTAVISGALPYVVSDFGFDTFMEGWFVSSALLGCIIGVVCSGKLSDWKGRKFVMLLSAGLFLLSAIGCMLATTPFWLILFRLAGGLGIGVASMICPLYISEISPPHRRGMMVALYQLAITVGIVAAYFSNAVLAKTNGASLTGFLRFVIVEDPWRSMIGLGLLPSVLFWIGLVFIPESPRWLLLKGRRKEAQNVLLRTTDDQSAANEINLIEAGLKTETNGLKQLFTRRYRTPLLIGLLLPFFAQASGINAVIYYGPSILDKAGFSLGDALGGQVVIGLVNVVFTFVAIFTVDRWGRKPLLILGISLAVISLAVIGFLFQQNIVEGPWILLFILLFIASFAFSFGPVTFVVISEIFPTAVRAQAVSLGILSMWTANFFVGQLTPSMLKSASWGPAATFWTFALLCAPALYLTVKLIPETKGKSLEEIEALWSDRKAVSLKKIQAELNS